MRITKTISIPDRPGPGSTMTASDAFNLQGTVKLDYCWSKTKKKSRASRYEEKAIRLRKVKSVSLTFGTLNVGTITGKIEN